MGTLGGGGTGGVVCFFSSFVVVVVFLRGGACFGIGVLTFGEIKGKETDGLSFTRYWHDAREFRVFLGCPLWAVGF